MSAKATMDETTPIDPDDELLVAYLDGELESATRDELEDRLLEDESLRLKLQSLQSGWEMLDVLPAPTTNERLVESTLELVVSDIMKIVPEETQSPQRHFRVPMIIGAIALATAGLGWFAGYQYRKSIERHQLVQLALAENLDAYLWGSDLSLMRILQSDPAWLNMLTTARQTGEINVKTLTAVSETPVDDRLQVVESLLANDRATLETRWNEFSELDTATLDKLRKTAQTVKVQPDAELLIDTMSQYSAWRASLPADMRDAIERSEGPAQKKAIANAITYSLDSMSRRSGGMLDEDTVLRIYHALDTFLNDRLERDPKLKAMFKENERRYQEGARLFSIARMISDDSRVRGRGRGPTPAGLMSIPKITMEELDSIIVILSDAAIDDLNLLTNWSPYSGHDPRLLESTLRTWAEETVRRKSEELRPAQGNLIDRYNELSESDRDELDLLSPSEIKRRLSGRYRPPFGR